MRWLLVVAAFVVVPLAELWAILEVGRAIGVGPTVLVLLADSVLGAVLLRSQGRRAWARFLDALRAVRVPSREVADGILILVGGALLLTPGFLTDVVGLILLIPPTRALVRRALVRRLGRRVEVRASSRGDVEGTATEYEAPPGRLDR
jgi:UPF0716 protein FxsA